MSTDTPDNQAATSIARHFAELPDPRVRRTRKYSLHVILTIAILAVICGADSWDQIEEFGRGSKDWLRTFLDLGRRTPSDDTFRRVFAALDPAAFHRCFGAWMKALAGSLVGKLVAIDGKTLRGSFDAASAQSPIHLVHAWAEANSLLLGQIATDVKSNEITAIPKLLALLDLAGAIVTIDAMGCQTAIAKVIVDGSADYILALKDNQPRTHEEVKKFFDGAIGSTEVSSVTTVDKGHGRIETRRVHATGDIKWFEDLRKWPKLKSFVAVERERTINGKTSYERAEYLTSLPASDIEKIAAAIRGHWSVENKLHWSLDVSFGEDASRIRDRNAAANFALIRRIALMLLRRETTVRKGAPSKRLRAAVDRDYLLRVLETGATVESAGFR